jgi:D-3-phosphoglycerate dehydrogenase / 2-oxoglutarate reductase
MTWRILISAPYLLPIQEEFRLRLANEGIEIVTADVRERLSEEKLLSLIGSIDGAICGDDPFTERVLNEAAHLKVISKWGTGIDSIDRVAAAKRGIKVCNTPDAFTDPVADTTLGYILCFARKLPFMDQEIRRGEWIKRNSVALRQCTLGVVGVGNIGKAVVRRAKAFGMKLMGSDPVPVASSFIEETGMEMAPLEALLGAADFVSLHCDLNQTSHYLIDKAELALMRPGSYLINTSRGRVVNESALVEALRTGHIAGAALDVFETEPLPPESPLRSFENCLFAPHNANSDPAARMRVHESTIENLLRGLKESI